MQEKQNQKQQQNNTTEKQARKNNKIYRWLTLRYLVNWRFCLLYSSAVMFSVFT